MKEFNQNEWYDRTIKQLLKPCPICGTSENIIIHAPNKHDKEDVQCISCGLKIEKALGMNKGAVACWNTRTKPKKPKNA